MPSPTSWSSVVSVSLTGSQTIDALLFGTRWASSNITYSFPDYYSFWSTSTTTGYGPSFGYREPWVLEYEPLSVSDKNYFAGAIQQWANVANLQFIHVPDTSTNVGDIRAAYSYRGDTSQAWAYLPASTSYAGDVWFSWYGTSAIEYWTPGSYEFMTLVHEMGHALGLKHPFQAQGSVSAVLPASLDSRSYTIMSYSAQPGVVGTRFSFEPTTPMILDIQAIQYVYGPNYGYRTGNDIYSFADSTPYHQTIWDAGGADTIQYHGYWNATIDLRQGYGSTIGMPVYVQTSGGANLYQVPSNVWIAYGVVIENAIGGNGNDVLTGNDSSNALDGGAGNDTLIGGSGNDIFDTNPSFRSGNDVFYGGLGDDVFVLDSINDSFIEYAGQGTDTVWAPFSFSLSDLPYVENLRAFGSTGASLQGNSANNYVSGTSETDTIDGGAGADLLFGGAGNDTYVVDNAGDVVTENVSEGIDLIQSAVTFTLPANVENLLLAGGSNVNATGNALANVLTGNSGNNVLDGGGGADMLDGGPGADILIGGGGNDTYAYSVGQDIFVDIDGTPGNFDTMGFGPGIGPADIGVYRTGSDLVLARRRTYDQDRVVLYQFDQGSSYWIEQVTFSGDSTVWTAADLLTRVERPGVAIAVNNAAHSGEGVSLAGLFQVSDPDGGSPYSYELFDGGAGGGYFRIAGGPAQPAGAAIAITSAQLAQTEYVGGSAPGSETVWVRAYDDLLWSEWTSWQMFSQTRPTNALPVINAPDRNIDQGQWRRVTDAVALFTVSDADGDSINQYEITDLTSGVGSGYFYANGAIQAQGASAIVNAADLANVWVNGGADLGANGFSIRAFDTFGWSTLSTLTLTTRLPNHVPTVLALNSSVQTGQAVAVGSLLSVSDADNDAPFSFELYDAGAAGGHFQIGATPQAALTTIAVTAAQLASTQYIAGPSTGSETLYARVYDGQAWSGWTSWQITAT